MIQTSQALLRTSLAASAAFQSLVGAADATAAAAKIYHDAFPKPANNKQAHSLDELNALRPCAIVYTEDFETTRDATDYCWHQKGVIRAVIYRNVPTADKNNQSKLETDFRTIMGEIMQDLIDLSETAGYLAVRGMRTEGPYRTDNEELNAIGDAQAYELIIRWGVEGQ